jgi:hypothetical protein
MSAKLPDGAIVTLSTTLGSAKTVSALTNANPGVATSTAHGFVNGDIVLMNSGWSNLNQKAVRVAGSVANAFNLDGIDTSLTSLYPAGSGTGSAYLVGGFTQISQIMGLTTQGGDQQYATFSFLEQNFETQLPTVFSAQSISLEIADDPSLSGYIALKAAADARAFRVLKLQLPDGSFILYYGQISFNETPSLNKGQVMVVKATFALQARPVRYAS